MEMPPRRDDETPEDGDRHHPRRRGGDGRAWVPVVASRGGPRVFAVASLVGIAVVLLAWSLVEYAWLAHVMPEERHALNALRGLLASLLVMWLALLAVQRR